MLPAEGPKISRAAAMRRIAGPVAALAACVLLLVLLQGLSRGLDYRGVIQALRETSRALIFVSILLTALSYIALVARDLSALSYIGVKVSTSALLLASFCGSALGNAVGNRALTAIAVRDRVYGAVGVRPEQTARGRLFNNVAFGIGLGAFTAICLMLAGSAMGRLIPISIIWIRCAGAVALLAIVGGLLMGVCRSKPVRLRRLQFEVPSLGNTNFHFLASIVDLAAAAAALWFLLPRGGIDFFSFAAIFSAAVALGVVSRVPGGLGVFEIVVFISLEKYVPRNELAAALLIYRGVYFVLPLMLAGAALAAFELRSDAVVRASKARDRVQVGADLLAPTFLSVITFAIGVMLILSGATPAVDWRLAALQGILPLWAVEISHLLATLAGIFLLFVSRGLYHRLDGAWWLTLLIALVNVGFSLAKGLAFGETAAILFLVFLLLATRRQFTRPATFLRQPFTIGWFIAIAAVIVAATGIMLFAFRDVAYRREIWWQFEFDAQASRSLRALLVGSILALGISLRQLLRTASGRVEPPSADELSRAASIIGAQERSAALLALMGDKSFLFSNSGKSLLMYAKRGRSWVALFDPVGPQEEWSELVWRFVELADAHSGRAAFYQVRPDTVPVYLDAGLRVVKVGEEACISLGDFSLQGSHRYGLRQTIKRAERDGMAFEISPAGRLCDEPNVLAHISDAWLAGHGGHERRFSVAAFEPGFVAAQQVALARQRGKPVAFVTYMTTERQTEATLGLIRQLPDAPPYATEYIITKVALELKTRKFERLSLGMAPLSGMVRTPVSSRWNRIAGLVWELGGSIYNFQGLRTFKNKFRPVWEPRYLAASGAIGPFITLAEVATLASGIFRGSSPGSLRRSARRASRGPSAA